MSISRQALSAATLCTSLILAASSSTAQSFGKNKVQYEPLHWSVLETPHTRLHFYAEEESLSRRLAAFAESVCVEYDDLFRVKFRRPIPVLFYSAHHLFQQTNATPGLISESVGGLTELIKGRVLIPHNGSWARLAWVTRHELAHAYMLEKLARVMREHKRNHGYLPPLWFIEGLAEYCGSPWDADAEGLLRDAVLTGRAMPLTRSDAITGTVQMYKQGQSFLLHLAERFGRDKVFDLLDNWYRGDNFEEVFKLTFEQNLADVDKEWFTGLKRRYYPAVATLQTTAEQGERLTFRGHYNLGPRVLPFAEADSLVRFCYFAAEESGISLMLSEPDKKGGRRERRLLSSGQSPSYESFHLFQNRPDASPSGVIALSAKRGGRDALYVIDGIAGKVLRRITFSNLVAILDPSLMPGDQAVVFSAQDYSGHSDLYRASWAHGRIRLERLTQDEFDDVEPDVSPDGAWVAFASDRGDRGGRYSLFRLSLTTAQIERVSTPEAGDDRQPVYSRDGRWLAFRSTRGGTSDLYVRPAEPSGEYRRVTRTAGPVLDPDWLADGRGLMFTGQERVEFQSYLVRFDLDTLEVRTEPATTPVVASLVVDAAADTAASDSSASSGPTVQAVSTAARDTWSTQTYDGEKQRYERRLSLDLIQNAFAVDPGMGAAGGGQIALSDVLGNEQVHIMISNNAERFGGSFWDGFEGGLTYINQSRRLNWGLGVFRLNGVYDPDLDMVRRERRAGVLGLARYPFSKFFRVEGSVMVRHASDHMLRNGQFTDVDLVSQFLSLIHDNTGWTSLGPSRGSRWILSAGFTRDMNSGAGDYTNAFAEFRHYEQPIPVMVSATRIQALSSFGKDAQRAYMGGRGSLRGFDRRALWGFQTLFAQQEFRLPLVRGLTFAIPTAWEFPSISAAAFADAALAWEYGTMRQLGSAGTALYIGGGYFPAFRWDFAWTTTDFHTFSRTPRTQFMIGYNW